MDMTTLPHALVFHFGEYSRLMIERGPILKQDGYDARALGEDEVRFTVTEGVYEHDHYPFASAAENEVIFSGHDAQEALVTLYHWIEAQPKFEVVDSRPEAEQIADAIAQAEREIAVAEERHAALVARQLELVEPLLAR